MRSLETLMNRLILLATFACGILAAADPAAQKQLIDRARLSDGASLSRTLAQTFSEKALTEGTAHASYGPEFLFAVRSASAPLLFVDDTPVYGVRRVAESGLWTALTRLETGTSHAFYFVVNGMPLKRSDVRAYTPDHYQQPGVRQGRLSEKMVHTSSVYAGMESDWWYYTSPGVEPGKPAALMVWQDGHRFAMRDSPSRLFRVTENLVHQKAIPPMVHVLIAPGYAGEKRMRSIEYDTVSDRYVRFVLHEILPELEKHQQIRKDGYSRGIGGQSSGGICSLNAAWHRPDAFARVLSRIGSYTAIAWRTKQMKGGDVLDGGHFYPSMVRKEDKRNIRVWMEDGAEDLENDHGSWPLQNIQLANSLKMREYDFRFVFGNAQHNTAYGDSLLPEALRWLWRGYDPAKRCLGLETQYHVARNGDAARKNACATSEPDWVRRRRLTSM